MFNSICTIDRFSTLKIHFLACLRLAKMLKLKDLTYEFGKKLYTLNIEFSEPRMAGSITSSFFNIENSDIKLSNFDTSIENPNLPIDEADIFCIINHN